MKKFKLLFASSLLLLAPITACGELPNPNKRVDKDVESVTLDVPYMKLEIGETLQLHPTVVTAEGVDLASLTKKWINTNPSVATITDEGLIMAVGSGRTTFTYLVGMTGSASCIIDVPFDDEEVDPTPGPTPDPEKYSIYLDESSVELAPQGQFQLTATQYNGEYEITWTSTGVVTVDSTGLVKAGNVVGEGSVTASANGESATCTFTVTESDDEGKKSVRFYFFIDYNGVDELDTTRTRLLAEFRWYPNRPLAESGMVPDDPTVAPTSEFQYFIGWSYRPIVDEKEKLINPVSWPNDNPGEDDIDLTTRNYVYIFGIWSDVPKESF